MRKFFFFPAMLLLVACSQISQPFVYRVSALVICSLFEHDRLLYPTGTASIQ